MQICEYSNEDFQWVLIDNYKTVNKPLFEEIEEFEFEITMEETEIEIEIETEIETSKQNFNCSQSTIDITMTTNNNNNNQSNLSLEINMLEELNFGQFKSTKSLAEIKQISDYRQHVIILAIEKQRTFYRVDKDKIDQLAFYNNLFLCEYVPYQIQCRMFFDIDLQGLQQGFEQFLLLIESIFGEMIVYDQSGQLSQDCYKTSYHLYSNQYFISDLSQFKQIIELLKDSYKDDVFVQGIDLKVYSKGQNIKLPFSAKQGSKRYKKGQMLLLQDIKGLTRIYLRQICIRMKIELQYEGEFEESDIISLDQKQLDISYLRSENSEIEGSILNNDIVKKQLNGYQIRETKQNNEIIYMLFDNQNQQMSFYCIICERLHETGLDNYFYITYFIKRGIGFINCRHCLIKGKGIKFDNSLVKKKTKQSFDIYKYLVQTQDLNCIIYDSIQNSMFDQDRIVFIKSPMGYGKTNGLIRYLSQKIKGGLCLYVSYRISQTMDIVSRFRKENCFNVINYMENEGLKKIKNRLSDNFINIIVVQFDSLYKLRKAGNRIDNCDIVIDEFVSVLIHSAQIIIQPKKKQQNIQFLIQCSQDEDRKMILMDANCEQENIDLATRVLKINSYKFCVQQMDSNKPKETLYVYESKANMFDVMIDMIKKGEKIVFCSNNLEKCGQVNKNIDQLGIKTVIVVGDETYRYQNQDKDNHEMKIDIFNDVNQKLKDIQVFIYSPCCESGVSVEVDGFDNIFGEFSNVSNLPLACVQMMGRIRKSKNIHLWAENNKDRQQIVQNKEIISGYTDFIEFNQQCDWIMDIEQTLYKRQNMLKQIVKYLHPYFTNVKQINRIHKKCQFKMFDETVELVTRKLCEKFIQQKQLGVQYKIEDRFYYTLQIVYYHLKKKTGIVTDKEMINRIVNYIEGMIKNKIPYYYFVESLENGVKYDDKSLIRYDIDLLLIVQMIQVFKDNGSDLWKCMRDGQNLSFDDKFVEQLKQIKNRNENCIGSQWINILEKICVTIKGKRQRIQIGGKRKEVYQFQFEPISLYIDVINNDKTWWEKSEDNMKSMIKQIQEQDQE